MSAPEAEPAAPTERDLARQDLCRFLAGCYYEPGPEFAEERLFDSMHAAAGLIDPALADQARALGQAYAAQPPQDLLVDYARLFLGPPQALARPCASAWLTVASGTAGDPTLELLALYRRGGFEMDPGFLEQPDHIAAELEFLYLLAHRRLAARLGGDADAAQAAQALRQALLLGHLVRWLPPFASALRAQAQTGFYRELAQLTEAFVQLEAGQAASASG